MPVEIGHPAPGFQLSDTEGTSHDPAGTTSVVIFTCNHCPYALAWHDRLAQAARDYADRGVRFFAINSNDAERYPADSYEAMQRRVAKDGGWPMPYLHDADQGVAREFGAKTTPDLFLLDDGGVLRYRGAPDSDYDDPSEDAGWLREAIDSVLAGEQPQRSETEPVGCSIKWKPG